MTTDQSPFTYTNDFSTEIKFGQIDLTDQISLFAVEGADAERYLHGRLTQEIKSLAIGATTKSMCLTPQGKIVGLFSVLRQSKDSFFLLFHGHTDDSFTDELLKFKVADRLSCNRVEPSSIYYSSSAIPEDYSNQIVVPFPLGEIAGSFLVTLNGSKSLHSEATASPELFHLLRIKNLIPWFGEDVTIKTAATEIPYTSYISFTKGCYAGQELVEMSISRGRPNYRLVQLSGKFSTPPSSAEKLVEPKSSKECGFITRGIFNPKDNSFLSLGFLKTSAGEISQALLNSEMVTVHG